EIQGRVFAPGEAPTTDFGVTTSNLFHTLGMPLIRGREFSDADGPKGEPVIMIDETAAERFWPNEDPVGKQIRFTFGRNPPWRRIVGVVGRSRTEALDAPYTPHAFLPATQVPVNALTVYVRTSSSSEALEEAIRREIQAVDPELPVFGVRSLQSMIADSLASR